MTTYHIRRIDAVTLIYRLSDALMTTSRGEDISVELDTKDDTKYINVSVDGCLSATLRVTAASNE